MDLALQHEGIKLTLLLRLGLCSPYNLLNYVLAVTRLSFKDYAIGSIAIVVHVLFDIVAAYTLSDFSKLLNGDFADSKYLILMILLELGFSIAMVVVIVRAVNNELEAVHRRHALRISD